MFGPDVRAVFRTPENQFIHLRGAGDDTLAASPEAGPTICETVWGVDDKAGLDAIGAELSKDREVTEDADGVLHSKDETGFSIAFQVSDRTVMDLDAPKFNLNAKMGNRVPVPDPDKLERNMVFQRADGMIGKWLHRTGYSEKGIPTPWGKVTPMGVRIKLQDFMLVGRQMLETAYLNGVSVSDAASLASSCNACFLEEAGSLA